MMSSIAPRVQNRPIRAASPRKIPPIRPTKATVFASPSVSNKPASSQTPDHLCAAILTPTKKIVYDFHDLLGTIICQAVVDGLTLAARLD